MVTKARGFEPDYAVPPGDTVLEELASRLGLGELELLELFQGNHPIDEKLAEALHKEIGPSARFWLNLEANYRAALERIAEANHQNDRFRQRRGK